MNAFFSIVIICKNAAEHIAVTIKSIEHLSDDIIIYDTGSTDNTMAIAGKYPVQLYSGPWEGYGKSRCRATEKAKYNWVFTIDSDEIAEPSLQKELAQLTPDDQKIVYAVRLRNFIGDKELRWGEWGNDFRPRLFHKAYCHWDEAIIHEKPVLSAGTSVKRLKGTIHHQYANDLKHYREKLWRYGLLTAEKYFAADKKPTLLKKYLSPLYAFTKAYIVRLGFLDGHTGFKVALTTARYTFLKYARLSELRKQPSIL
ncbi:MAG TPA: glycosyltransferase family 2 protein [Flavisolibacter sp.]|jgi:glycosyltransferase involved in cell wall biosynthesis|nr:glycosyltransferase family 2 protein [Flavisolibacter sp.]